MADANWDPWPIATEWAVAELELFDPLPQLGNVRVVRVQLVDFDTTDNVECRDPPLVARFSGAGFVGGYPKKEGPSIANFINFLSMPGGVACGAEGAWLEAQPLGTREEGLEEG
ncbi:hetN [Symbiodinium microadriaticum]|nr:hetN [Symbiodinium microadriaticum]